jgi:hypothetical protein
MTFNLTALEHRKPTNGIGYGRKARHAQLILAQLSPVAAIAQFKLTYLAGIIRYVDAAAFAELLY